MRIVEVDGGLERAARDRNASARGEVGGHVVAELVEEHEELAVRRGEFEPRRIEIDDRGARGRKRRERVLDRRRHRCRCRHEWIESGQPAAGQPEFRALQILRVRELRVVGRDVCGARLSGSLPAQRNAAGRGIAMIGGAALDHAQRRRRILRV